MNYLKNKRIALVYDRVNKWGGAERVLLALHNIFPEAPLYTAVYNKQNAEWARVFKVIPSFLQNIPYASGHHEVLPLFMPLAFESFAFDEYDLVISVTSEAAKGIITKPHTKHLCYCLTPTRYLWSGYHEYFNSPLFRILSRPLVSYLRNWDARAAQRPDMLIAISGEVKNRISKYYGREAEVVYPPVVMANGNPPAGGQMSNIKVEHEEDYFLVVSRLVPYKRIDIAIKACSKLGLPLVVTGTGSEENKLRAMAGSTITFAGQVPEEQLAELYRNCRGLIFPGNEDFGLVMAEAMAYGKPVIAYKAGGALDIVLENKTGILFAEQNPDALCNALQIFPDIKFSPTACRQQSSAFSFDRFRKRLLSNAAILLNS